VTSTSAAPSRDGASQAAIMRHYDVSDEYFRLWLGEDLVYSCAWWEPDEGPELLSRAQLRKIDFFAERLHVDGARVLDVGCGWGALLDRFVRVHGAAAGVGIALSPAQAVFAGGRDVPGVAFRVESWVDHEPSEPYDAIACVEATEHFASDQMKPDEKVTVYRDFFRRAASWLRPGGRLGLQAICLDDVGHAGTRAGRGPFTDLILEQIFPESMSPSLSELVLGWETHFELDELHAHPDHYRKTFRAWALAHRRNEAVARELVGEDTRRTFARYLAGGEALFRLREQTLYRAVLRKRPEPKVWAVTVSPSDVAEAHDVQGASATAVRAHYDLSNAFYQDWLGPSMMYSSGLWPGPSDGVDPAADVARPDVAADLEQAHRRKIDFFARHVLPDGSPRRVLDVGCGWGGTLRRLQGEHHVSDAVGLTLSAAQQRFLEEHPIQGAEIRLEDWRDHEPTERYGAIVTFGAFEHFARDGTTGPQRIAAYLHFFHRCWEWLSPGGRIGLETIAHDNASDTSTPRGRGPLGDFVLALFPESLCPHLGEIILGLEPYFQIEVLRSDGADFARTFRAWLVALRDHEHEASAIAGEERYRQYRRYLSASEIQFRTRVITNYRLVLRRRDHARQ
jgi:cyclopropane-fatty-acyl-phospholipid synthase